MRVGVLCEFSGIVRDAFLRRGHDAISCDLLPTESPGPHIQGDCLAQDWSGFDLLICHPPCTYLCNSGVRWLWHGKKSAERPCASRWQALYRGREFFMACLDLCRKVGCGVCENPIPHKYADLPRYRQRIQPWEFGHPESKATCLWIHGLPDLLPTNVVAGRAGRVHRESPGPDRWKRRSVTMPGIAEAMAEQWGSLPATSERDRDERPV